MERARKFEVTIFEVLANGGLRDSVPWAGNWTPTLLSGKQVKGPMRKLWVEENVDGHSG